MWAALRSDLQEFVSTVSEESTQALTNIDAKLKDEEVEQEQDEEEEEENDNVDDSVEQNEDNSPQRTSAGGGVLLGDDPGVMMYDGAGYESTGIVSSAADEVARLRGCEATYTEELPDTPDVNNFLSEFDPSDALQTDVISKVLQAHPDSVEAHFSNLVPTEVSYEQFWQRYFYLCDEARVEKQWEEEKEERIRARNAAREALLSNAKEGFSLAKNLVGSAIHAVVGDNEAEEVHSSAHTMATGGIMRGGRPPFVLQTNEEDDDEVEVEDEESEEELGWDDDDDEEEDDADDSEAEESSSHNLDRSEEIVFDASDSASADQRLKVAQEEMDQLHQTIEMQRLEIERLGILGKEGKELGAFVEEQVVVKESAGVKSKATAFDAKCDEVAKLEMIVFEKNSELAALKAKLEDDQHDERPQLGYDPEEQEAALNSLTQDIDSLSRALEEREAEIVRLNEELAAQRNAGAATNQRKDDEVSSLINSLQARLDERDSMVTKLQESMKVSELAAIEAENTSRTQQTTLEEARAAIHQLQSDLAASKAESERKQEQIASLQSQLRQSSAQMSAAAKATEEEKDAQIKAVKEELEASYQRVHSVTAAGDAHSSSPQSSYSSGVKIGASDTLDSRSGSPLEEDGPAASDDKKPGNENVDDEDDWGDSWGDDADLDDV